MELEAGVLSSQYSGKVVAQAMQAVLFYPSLGYWQKGIKHLAFDRVELAGRTDRRVGKTRLNPSLFFQHGAGHSSCVVCSSGFSKQPMKHTGRHIGPDASDRMTTIPNDDGGETSTTMVTVRARKKPIGGTRHNFLSCTSSFLVPRPSCVSCFHFLASLSPRPLFPNFSSTRV